MDVQNFWVDIESQALPATKYGSGPIRARNFRRNKKLSASGEFSFEVELSDPNIGALQIKRIAVCRYIQAGVIYEFGAGLIDSIRLQVAEDGTLYFLVSGNDIARMLANRSVGALQIANASAGVTDGPARIMAKAPTGWTVANGTTATPVYGAFDGETVLNALWRLGQHIGEHWRLGTGRNIEWLGPAANFQDCGVRAIQHVNDPAADAPEIALISAIEEIQDAAEIVTRVYPKGSGNGNAAVTLAAATESPPAGYVLNKATNSLTYTAADVTYDRIERGLDFKEIGPLSNSSADVQNSANMLLQASAEYLRQHRQPEKFYQLTLDGLHTLIDPGTTIQVVYRRVEDGAVLYDLNSTLNVLEVEHAIDETGLQTTAVTVSTTDRTPETDGEIMARQMQSARVFAAYPQLNANSYVTSFREAMDAGAPALIDFWLGREVVNVHQVCLRFRIDPLRSTVKSVGAETVTSSDGGGSQQTSSSGGGSTQTSSSGGGATPTSAAGGGATVSSAGGGGATVGGGSHNHVAGPVFSGVGDGLPVYAQIETSALVSLYVDGMSGGPRYLEVGVSTNHTHDLPDHTHAVTVPGHTHTVDVPAHTHSLTIPDHTHDTTIPDHTHDVTPQIETVYGLFEESGANTLEVADLAYTVNSLAAGPATDIGGGWYELDVTDLIIDLTTYRPLRATNQIRITTGAAKTALITGQLMVRTVIQAVALL